MCYSTVGRVIFTSVYDIFNIGGAVMDNKKIGSFIAQQRKKIGYSQRDLAEKLNVTDKAVSKWETGRGVPDVSLIIDVADALQVSVVELLNGEYVNKDEIHSKTDRMLIESMSKTKKTFFVITIISYIATITHFFAGRIYALGEYVFGIKLLPEFIWKFLNFAFYKESGAIKFVLSILVIMVLMIVLLSAFGKNISRITTILIATLIVPPVIYLFCLAISDVSIEFAILILFSFILCVVHYITTAVLLIKDIKRFK